MVAACCHLHELPIELTNEASAFAVAMVGAVIQAIEVSVNMQWLVALVISAKAFVLAAFAKALALAVSVGVFVGDDTALEAVA